MEANTPNQAAQLANYRTKKLKMQKQQTNLVSLFQCGVLACGWAPCGLLLVGWFSLVCSAAVWPPSGGCGFSWVRCSCCLVWCGFWPVGPGSGSVVLSSLRSTECTGTLYLSFGKNKNESNERNQNGIELKFMTYCECVCVCGQS